MALWALAKLRANRPKLLRVLADRADVLSEELNPQDLATVVWAFGSLQHRPDAAVLQRLAEAAAFQFDQFQPQVRQLMSNVLPLGCDHPAWTETWMEWGTYICSLYGCAQGISMLIWGFAKLDRVPVAALLRQCMQHFETRLPSYQHQAIANMFFSLARLQQSSPRLCQAVQAQAAARIKEFSAQVSYWPFSCISVLLVASCYKPQRLTPCSSRAGAPKYTVGLCKISLHATPVPGCAGNAPCARGRCRVFAALRLGSPGLGLRLPGDAYGD